MLRLIAGISLLLWNRALLRLGLRKPLDGWRRGAGLSLRGETARFYLTAFALDVFSDDPSSVEPIEAHLGRRLAAFLSTESAFAVSIRHERDQDVVVPEPSPSYRLTFQPWVMGPGRFIRPDAWRDHPPSPDMSPVFEFVARIDPDRRADLWLRINHVAVDGVPTQELLSRLEAAWSVAPLLLPTIAEFQPFTAPRPTPGRPGTVEVQALIDFAPVLAWRKRINSTLPEPMTFSAALMWWLAKHERFAGLHLGTTVELPASNGLGRGVGVVTVRPGDYFGAADGVARYVQNFNRQLDLTRRRASESCRTLDAAAYLPPRLEAALLQHALNDGHGPFGSVGLTIIKDAKVFGAPLGDAGHADGFIAIGGIALPTSDARRVGCVVVKGPGARIADYARVLADAIAAAR